MCDSESPSQRERPHENADSWTEALACFDQAPLIQQAPQQIPGILGVENPRSWELVSWPRSLCSQRQALSFMQVVQAFRAGIVVLSNRCAVLSDAIQTAVHC